MDAIDTYVIARCLMLAGALRSLDDLDPAAQADALIDAAELLDPLAEALTDEEQDPG